MALPVQLRVCAHSKFLAMCTLCPHWPAIRVPSLHGTALEEVVCVEHVLHDVQPTLSQLVCYVCCPWQQASCGLVCYGHSPMPVVFPTGGMMYCSVFAGETDSHNVFHCRVLY